MTSPYFKASSYRSPASTQSTFYTHAQTTPKPSEFKAASPTLKSAYVSRDTKLQSVYQKYDKEAQDVNKKYVQHYQEHLDLGNSLTETQSALEEERRRNAALDLKLDECFREIDQQKRQKVELARENTELREEGRKKDRVLADLQLKANNVQQNANSVNYENEDFRREMKRLSDTYNIKLKEIEEKYKAEAKGLNEEIDRLKSHLKEQDINVEAKVRGISRDFEAKVRSLENQIREKDRIMNESAFEMRSLKEYNMKVKMDYEEELRRQLIIIKDSERVSQEGVNKELENIIKQLETEKELEVKKIEALAQEIKGKDKMLKEIKVRAEDQVGALRKEHIQLNDQISVLNSEIERLHTEIVGKESSIGKLHQEIKNLNVEVGRQKDYYLPEIDRLMVKNDTDIKKFQDYERKLKARIADLERSLKNSEAESNKLRVDIEKLRENIAGSIHKTIALTFEGYGTSQISGKAIN